MDRAASPPRRRPRRAPPPTPPSMLLLPLLLPLQDPDQPLPLLGEKRKSPGHLNLLLDERLRDVPLLCAFLPAVPFVLPILFFNLLPPLLLIHPLRPYVCIAALPEGLVVAYIY